MHFNVGMLHDRQQSSNKHTLGMGSEFALGQRFLGIAEVFGDDTQTAFYQFGLRYAVVPEQLQVDTTLGWQNNVGTAGQWMSIGIRWTP